ncbi:DUF4249 domain-containing protein [uncultured Arcticibacterium sp.]|uniref:DUF4249 domain-containing protein n=1 Tax=uncultured Arcticibacterium sp. TaxID=2173042 RepID=UPI0030FD1488
MHKIKLLFSLLCVFLFLTQACVDTYSVSIEGSKKYLIVEGTITNVSDQRQIVKIFETDDQSDFVSTEFSKTIFSIDNEAIPLENIMVEVYENESIVYQMIEKAPGVYEMPSGFFAEVGNTYQLKFTTTDGLKYESSVEEMLPVAEITNFEVKYNEEGITKPRLYNLKIPTHDYYLDFDDPAEEVNFYSWSWTDYEVQNICHTCQQGRFFTKEELGTATGECVTDDALHPNNIYDYYCQGFCWELFEGEDIQIFSDVFTNGQSQKGKLVAQVPAFQSNSCLVTIQQKSLTAGAFRYLKLIEDQSIKSGSLADTPPAPIRSNVVNINQKEELVLGYFSASAVKEVRHMLNREGITGIRKDNLFSILNNRDPVPETDGDFRFPIPLAPCVASETRTPVAPRNWQFGI